MSLPVWSRPSGKRATVERQFALAAALFAVLVLGIIFLYGHLISRSLSRQYLQDVLVSGREEARRIADTLGEAGVGELEVVEKRREELYRTLAGLPQRRIIESIEVVNSEGEIVFTSEFTSRAQVPENEVAHLELSGTLSDQDMIETESSFRLVAPLGEVGEVVLNVSKARIIERVVDLRQELLRQTTTVAVLTLVALVIAFGLVWFLLRRTRRLEARRREAEELATLGALAANLAHEIRNPLNSINLNLELLEEDLDGGGTDAVGSLKGTRQEVGRLARLVSDFLTYARPREPTIDLVPVVPLLSDVVGFLRTEARRIGAHLRLAPDLPEVELEGDASQLRQVLLNLVQNAVQAVAELEPERRFVEVSAEASETEVSLFVRDRGNGVPEDEIDRVRTAFYTRRRGGTGLGLAIADRIVEWHGGRIELCNLEPSGFQATVVLPLSTRDVKIGKASVVSAEGAGKLVRVPGSG